jgi:hypothetical protein
MRARLFTIALGLVPAGCLFYPDLGDLSGGTKDAGASDAAVTDAAADAPSDAPSGDGGRFCAGSNHAFCADFDEGAVDDGWDGKQIDLGSIVASTAQRVSSPNAALITMPRRSDVSPLAYATLYKKWPGFVHVVVDFDAFIVAPAWQNGDINSGVFTMAFTSSTANEDLNVSVGRTYTTVGNPGADANGAELPTDRWIHFHFDVDPAKSMIATIDGKPFNSTWPALVPGTGRSTVVTIGVSGYNRPAPEYKVYYDDLTVDLK